MATYGESASGRINTTTGGKQEDNIASAEGIFRGLQTGQPKPENLKVPQKDLLVFFRQLAVVLQSGISLAQGMILIADNMRNQKLAHCVKRIAARLSAGEELSVSLRHYPKVFKPLTIGLIEAGEAGGILDQVLERIASLMEDQAKLRGQIIGALIYPSLVFLLAITVSLGLLIFIVPRFEAMFDGMGADLPALTAFMFAIGTTLSDTSRTAFDNSFIPSIIASIF